jgi:DNA-binding response OmpR family regulator
MTPLLLIDDDRELCELLTEYLGHEQFQVQSVHRGDEAVPLAIDGQFELIILDVMLPGMSGTEVLRQIREVSTHPVLMLTARGDDVDRIVGLEMGADDYLPKPFNPRELLARLRAIMRRVDSSASPGDRLSAQDLEMHPAARGVTAGGKAIDLTSTEFSILETLMRHPGEVVSKEQLSMGGLGRPLGRFDRSIDMHLSNLRRKLGPLPDNSNRIETVRGIGYLLKSP